MRMLINSLMRNKRYRIKKNNQKLQKILFRKKRRKMIRHPNQRFHLSQQKKKRFKSKLNKHSKIQMILVVNGFGTKLLIYILLKITLQCIIWMRTSLPKKKSQIKLRRRIRYMTQKTHTINKTQISLKQQVNLQNRLVSQISSTKLLY